MLPPAGCAKGALECSEAWLLLFGTNATACATATAAGATAAGANAATSANAAAASADAAVGALTAPSANTMDSFVP